MTMSKNTIVRRDAPHEVSMPAGSRDASSRARSKPTSVKEPEPAVKRMVRTPKSEPMAASQPQNPEPPKRMVRPKAALGGQVSAPAADAGKASKVSSVARSQQREPRADADLWSDNSTILHQLGRLKARNAQVSEQIQRLQQPAVQPGGPLK